MGRYEKHLEDERVLAEIATADEMASKVAMLHKPHHMAHPLDWTWNDHKGVPRKHKLEEFRDGSKASGIAGIPCLIHELAPSIRMHLFGKAPATHDNILTSMRRFWQFLTNPHSAGPFIVARSLSDINCDTATLYYGDLRDAIARETLTEFRGYSHWRQFCSLMRRAGCDVAMWPDWPHPRLTTVHKDVSLRSVKYLYEAAKRVVSEGRALHATGLTVLGRFESESDLIELTDEHRPGRFCPFSPLWNKPNNILFTVYRQFRAGLSGNCASKESPALVLGVKNAIKRLFPVDEFPGSDAWRTPSDLLPLFASTSLEAIAALTLVTAETGWVDTARAIDVSSDDWFREGRRQTLRKRSGKIVEIPEVIISAQQFIGEDNTLKEVEITANRPKTKRRHQTRSLMQSENGFRAFAVIRYMIERTRLLREIVKSELNTLQDTPTLSTDCMQRIAELEEQLRCPWLFFRANGKGISGFTPGADKSSRTMAFRDLKVLAVSEAIRRGERLEVVEGINSLTPSDFRDAYAAWIYNRTGNDIFAVQAALNHRRINTTRMYLRQRAQMRDRFAACARVIGGGFDEIQSNRVIDPTILRLLADRTGQKIVEEDRAFLAEFRSTCGARCADPTNPPEEIEPASDRVEGEMCVTQRCGLCRYAHFDAASLHGVAVRIAELKALCAVTPSERWLMSVYSVELEMLDLLVEEKFADHSARVWGWVREHRRRLERGDALVFGVMSVETASIQIRTNHPESTK